MGEAEIYSNVTSIQSYVLGDMQVAMQYFSLQRSFAIRLQIDFTRQISKGNSMLETKLATLVNSMWSGWVFLCGMTGYFCVV